MAPKRLHNNAVTRVADKFGGLTAFADLIKVPPSTVRSWSNRGGHIPGRHHAAILALGKKMCKRVTPAMLVNV